MKLLDLLVKELPKRGGWPEGAARLAQDPDGDIQMLSNRNAYLTHAGWTGDGRDDFHGQYAARKIEPLSSDYTTAIITRAQYEAALADSEGWIEWGGGECPVKNGVLVDIRDGDGYEWHGVKAAPKDEYSDAADTFWEHKGSPGNNIIAYRLHEPEINSRVNDDRLEQDLNECIGQDVDVINHPSHYTKGSIECIDAIDSATAGKTGIEAVAVANVIKYLWRYEEKGGLESVRKAKWYLNKLISELESK